MRIRSERADVDIDTDSPPCPPIHGGEGDVYVVPPDLAAKVYHTAVLTRRHQEKVLALCSKYNFYRGILNRSRVAFPQHPVSNRDDNHIVGFSMQYFGSLPELANISFEWAEDRFKTYGGRGLTDDAAVALVYDLYEALECFRRANVALGDVHPGNILYDWQLRKPVFLDIDSAHIEQFPATAFKPEYIDPLVDVAGREADFTYLSDRFSMAVVAYELFVGLNPFFLRCDPNEGVRGNKRLSISLLGHHRDASYMASRNVTLVDNPVDRHVLARLGVLKELDRRLYDYLSDVLLGTCRDSLLQRLPRSDRRHPANLFASKGARRTLAQELEESRISADEAPVPTTIMNPQAYVGQMVAFALQKEARQSDDPPEFISFVASVGCDYLGMVRKGINVV